MNSSIVLASWLFPNVSQIHPAWFASWFAPGLVPTNSVPNATPVGRLIERRIRSYCNTPQIPQDDFTFIVCSLSDRHRMMLGQQIASHICAASIRKQIGGHKVSVLKSVLGEQEYNQVVHTTPTVVMPNHLSDALEQLMELNGLGSSPRNWWMSLSIRLLERLMGEQCQFTRKRLSLQVTPYIWQQRPMTPIPDREALQALCKEHKLLEVSDMGSTLCE